MGATRQQISVLNHLGLVVSYVTLAGRGGKTRKSSTDLSSTSSNTLAQKSMPTAPTHPARRPSNADSGSMQGPSIEVIGVATNAGDVESGLDTGVSSEGSESRVDGTGGEREYGGVNQSGDASGTGGKGREGAGVN